MTDITLKGWTLEHPSVITATTIMFAYVVVFVLVLTVLGKLKKDMWVINKWISYLPKQNLLKQKNTNTITYIFLHMYDYAKHWKYENNLNLN